MQMLILIFYGKITVKGNPLATLYFIPAYSLTNQFFPSYRISPYFIDKINQA